MRAVDLGEFLRSRRARLDPAALGLPDTDRRRAAGLRREEVATLAGVTVSWLTKIEQGHAHAVSTEVLASLARALQLDEAECVHLYALAGLRLDRRTGSTAVTPALRTLLDELDPNPAYILDRAWYIVAFNDSEGALFPPLRAFTVAPNLLELVFCNKELQRLMVDCDQEAARLVAQLRAHRADWPDDADLAAVIDRLAASSDRFAQLWAANDVAPFASTRREFAHSRAGSLAFDHHRLAVLDQPGYQLVVYTSAGGSHSAQRLRSQT